MTVMFLHGKVHFSKAVLTHYSIITPFDAFAISYIENIMKNGAFALLEQMLHFSYF